ncbi:MAG: hypothetical protein WC659_00580 [Patescibacteria group bacterium]
MEKIENQRPFNIPIEKGIKGETKQLYKFVDNDNYVVRFAPLRSSSRDISTSELSPEEAADMGIKLFRELRDGYNLIVPAQFVRGKWKQYTEGTYTIVNRIEGKSLEDMYFDSRSDCLVSKLDDLFESLLMYVNDKFHSEDYFLWDIFRKEQYVWGKKIEDNRDQGEQNKDEEDIYLTDVDIFAFRKSKHMLYAGFQNLLNNINTMEQRLDTKFEKTRKKLSEISSLFPRI